MRDNLAAYRFIKDPSVLLHARKNQLTSLKEKSLNFWRCVEIMQTRELATEYPPTTTLKVAKLKIERGAASKPADKLARDKTFCCRKTQIWCAVR